MSTKLRMVVAGLDTPVRSIANECPVDGVRGPVRLPFHQAAPWLRRAKYAHYVV